MLFDLVAKQNAALVFAESRPLSFGDIGYLLSSRLHGEIRLRRSDFVFMGIAIYTKSL